MFRADEGGTRTNEFTLSADGALLVMKATLSSPKLPVPRGLHAHLSTGRIMTVATNLSSFEVEVFYDGDCPLCMREIRMLRRRDKRGRIQFTNIAAEGFEASTLGLDHAALMGKIHGRLPAETRDLQEQVVAFRDARGLLGRRFVVREGGRDLT